jgi:hypothetical protein
MNNPEALAFINNRMRVRCEQLRALQHLMTDDYDAWTGGINANVPNTSEAVEDGREAEGVSRLTCDEVWEVLVTLNNLLQSLNAAGVMDPIHHACVRPLDVGLAR